MQCQHDCCVVHITHGKSTLGKQFYNPNTRSYWAHKVEHVPGTGSPSSREPQSAMSLAIRPQQAVR